MDLTTWITQAKDLSVAALTKTSGAVGAGVGFVQTQINKYGFFGSTETSTSYETETVDEKHYFLIPNHGQELGYSLYTMRCLPDGVPPINNLTKRRIFHLPNEHALPTLEHMLLCDAREIVQAQPATPLTIGKRLNELADQIDQLDGKVFNGVLLIGGLVALANPVAGAVLTMKALVPSVGLLISKFGLRYVGDSANSLDLASRIRAAEKDVLKQFRQAGAESVVNPLLNQLDLALRTTEAQYNPSLQGTLETMDFGMLDRHRMLKLTCQAITNTYQEILNTPDLWADAHLAPEDIRYLKSIAERAREMPKTR